MHYRNPIKFCRKQRMQNMPKINHEIFPSAFISFPKASAQINYGKKIRFGIDMPWG